jgi:hypothetical protein
MKKHRNIPEEAQNEEIRKYLKNHCNDGKYEHFKRLGKLIEENPRS